MPSPLMMDPARQAEIGLCVLLAVSDGDISEDEIRALSSRLGCLLGDDFPAIAVASIVDAEISRMSNVGPDRYVESLVARLPKGRRKTALRGALTVAFADGLAPEEEQMFFDVAAQLHVERAEVERMLSEQRTPSEGLEHS
jgi:hypothetical protein